MPKPWTRAELDDALHVSFDKLSGTLDEGGARCGSLPCIDAWTVKDLLVVRTWWTESVAGWVAAGQRGDVPVTPAEGYRWRDTPRLNDELVRRARRESFASVRRRLAAGFEEVVARVADLSDEELLVPHAFVWAGRYPVARWVAMNTVRQYQTARTAVRRVLRER